MFTIMARTTTKNDKMSQIKDVMNKLKDIDVLIGIPQEKDPRPKNTGVGNAELLFIHTKGSPLRGIPARPVIEPAIEDDKEAITDLLGEALKCILDGNVAEANSYLEKAGLEGQGAAQDWFTNTKNNWAQNSPATIIAKQAKGSTNPMPLIDTGEMRKAITYIIRGDV